MFPAQKAMFAGVPTILLRSARLPVFAMKKDTPTRPEYSLSVVRLVVRLRARSVSLLAASRVPRRIETADFSRKTRNSMNPRPLICDT
jgi:hypothetical protein